MSNSHPSQFVSPGSTPQTSEAGHIFPAGGPPRPHPDLRRISASQSNSANPAFTFSVPFPADPNNSESARANPTKGNPYWDSSQTNYTQVTPLNRRGPINSQSVSSTQSLPPPLQLNEVPVTQAKSKPPRKKRAPRKKTVKAPVGVPDPPPSSTNNRPAEHHYDSDPEINLAAPSHRSKRQRVEPEVLEKLSHESLEELRVRAAKYAEYIRLTAEDKVVLDEAYRQYQRAVLKIAIERKLHVKPVLSYLGNEVRIRGPTNFNNFCKYDEIAGPIYHDKSIPIADRMTKLSELWSRLDEVQKDQWRDQEFLDSITPPDYVIPPESDRVHAAPKWRKREAFKLNNWTRKMKRDLKNLSTSHQVEGFFVLASRDPDGPILSTGGSLMAEEFLDIMAADTNPCRSFYNFVNGQQAIKDISGKPPPPLKKRKRRSGKENYDPSCPYDLGSREANIEAVREKLRDALRKATHGVWADGWPGTKTEKTLRSLGVTLQVQQNDLFIHASEFCKRPSDMRIGQTQRILTAFAKGWVRLISRASPDTPEGEVSTIGNDLSDDDSNHGPANHVAITAVKRPKQPRKPKGGKKKHTATRKSNVIDDSSDSSDGEDSPPKTPRPKRSVVSNRNASLRIETFGTIRLPRSVTPPDSISQSPLPEFGYQSNPRSVEAIQEPGSSKQRRDQKSGNEKHPLFIPSDPDSNDSEDNYTDDEY
ncbi:uncharacterized protein PGTG_13975 [Puccinia graminis f. sp. tritici CRL 75-36-700-3]|uniref:Uncharacterized protein n=1 Tax=Puccinia graminis f. sp. tritici (strain CRL 75-36-700-3 / race SCCL) TaxID=418459 RepID=E3KTH9_PUCGT|nr:uncharacterized protein PGTG_13975 [Puccinia graminis f. sp. tritici CRL 75-36-700-3]EFP87604.1 hypothetical protein PGTG_13975 [Puccinia graminis f. sp. tritici CRL 75-36-700-3]